MVDALIFDLDDTLYIERDFVASGFRAVARHIASRNSCRGEMVFDRLMSIFDSQGRRSAMSAAVSEFMDSSAQVRDLVEIYRQHVPSISLIPGYEGLLRRLHKEFKLGILTDGLPEVQRRKVEALQLEGLVDAIVYTWDYGPELEKPHPFGFELILAALGVPPSGSLFVGDNPVKDGRGAHNAGMKFIRVCTEDRAGEAGGRNGEEKADFHVRNLHELPDVLRLAESYETN